jgi:hypothetical protein
VIAVHQVGLLHRDIKPSNVLLEGRSPVLIDFGLARLTEDPRLTQTGWLLGTPGYLAPEILYGDDATTASDVHSWAATVVFACTGRPPFGTGPAMAIMDRVRRGEHDLTGVPPALRPLLQACLDPDPARRPGTWDLLDALRRSAPAATTRVPVVAPEPPTARLRPGAPATLALPTAPQRPPAGATVMAPSRSPYMQPAPPQPRPQDQPARAEPAARSRPGPMAQVLLLALLAVGALGFARAPFLTVLVAGALTLGVRTTSWVTESSLGRRVRRGRRRWYDGPLTVLTSPWYLLLAAAGTLLLLGWALGVAALVALVYLLLAGPLVPGMVASGAVFSLALWSGPGSRRLRGPSRHALGAVSRPAWTAWVVLGLLAVAALVLASGSGSVVWDPAPGAPWRDGTSLGSLLGWLRG